MYIHIYTWMAIFFLSQECTSFSIGKIEGSPKKIIVGGGGAKVTSAECRFPNILQA